MTNYSKIRKIILLGIAALLAVVILVGIICVVYAHSSIYPNVEPSAFYSNWMSHISDNALVKDVVIPGSHDAGAYTLNWTSKTQDEDLMAQLKNGTRYFDMRVEKYKDNLYIYHNFRGTEAEPLLRQVKTFLLNNRTETVILDFQHFKGGSQEDVRALLDEIFSTTYMVTNYSSTTTDVDFINNLKMSSARGKCIIFWGSESDTTSLGMNYIYLRNDNAGDRLYSALHSFYDGPLNKLSSKNYIEQGLPLYIEKYKAVGTGMFVLQGQLTDGMFVFGPKFRERTHAKNMDQYVIELADSENLQYINIIMRDFVNVTKNSLAIQLNLQKGNVKTTSVDTFMTELSAFVDVSYVVPAE